MGSQWPKGEQCAAAEDGTPHAGHPWGYKRGGGANHCKGVPERDGASPLPLDPTQRSRIQKARRKAAFDQRQREGRPEVDVDAEIDAAIGAVFFDYDQGESA